ncbi:DUF6959 family protein [Streptomyces hyaluromycini]|uniref:DUF6959 family protein n=1 Tax=Streptomyces hyaluromycini TaxID=1377993 RepID=UPI003F659C6A
MTEVELLQETVACALVRRSSRRFPGLLVQGDTLRSLKGVADELLEELSSGDSENARYSARELQEGLAEFVAHYEEMMRAAGCKLPY